MLKKFVNFFFEEEEVETSKVDDTEFVDELPVQRKTVVKEEPLFYDTVKRPSTFIDLVDQEPDVKPIEKKTREKSTTTEKPISPDYVFTSVISPIFGATEEEAQKAKSPKKQAYPTQNTTKDSLLGTIISPIYGKLDMNQINKSDALSNELESKEIEEELPPLFSLEDLILDHRKLDVEAELHQYSLFEVEQQELPPSPEEQQASLGIRDYFEDGSKKD